MSKITLPRSVGKQLKEVLFLCRRNAFYGGQVIPNFWKVANALEAALTQALIDDYALRGRDALDAALAEPEPTVKESLTVDHIRSIWRDSWQACPNDPTPVLAEHFARQIERAHGIGLAKPINKDSLQGTSEDEVEAMMPRPAPSLAFLDGFRDGWKAAERFHGITKEDKP